MADPDSEESAYTRLETSRILYRQILTQRAQQHELSRTNESIHRDMGVDNPTSPNTNLTNGNAETEIHELQARQHEWIHAIQSHIQAANQLTHEADLANQQIQSLIWKQVLVSTLQRHIKPFELISNALNEVQEFDMEAQRIRHNHHDADALMQEHIRKSERIMGHVRQAIEICDAEQQNYPLLKDAKEYFLGWAGQIESEMGSSLSSLIQVTDNTIRFVTVSKGLLDVLYKTNQLDMAVADLLQSNLIANKSVQLGIKYAPVFLVSDKDRQVSWEFSTDSVSSSLKSTKHNYSALENPASEIWTLSFLGEAATWIHLDRKQFDAIQARHPCATDIVNAAVRAINFTNLLFQSLLGNHPSADAAASLPPSLVQTCKTLDHILGPWILDALTADPSFILGSTSDEGFIRWAIKQEIFKPNPVVPFSGTESASNMQGPKEVLERIEAAFLVSSLISEATTSLKTITHSQDSISSRPIDMWIKAISAEIRAQIILFTRRSSMIFADSFEASASPKPRVDAQGAHGVAAETMDGVTVAPFSAAWRPAASRPANWFGSCLVSRSAMHLLFIIQSSRLFCAEVLKTPKDPESVIQTNQRNNLATAVISGAREALESFRSDIPVQFADQLEDSLRLQMLFYNDCMMLAHAASSPPATPPIRLVPTISRYLSAASVQLRVTADDMIASLNRNCLLAVLEKSGLSAAMQDGSLAHLDGIYTRRKVENVISRCLTSIKEITASASLVLNSDLAVRLVDQVGTSYLLELVGGVLQLVEIGTDVCDGIHSILTSSVKAIDSARDESLYIPALEEFRKQRQEAYAISISAATVDGSIDLRKDGFYDIAKQRALLLADIMQQRMDNIVSSHHAGLYKNHFSVDDLANLICAIFEDTDHRMLQLAKLRSSPSLIQSTMGHSYRPSGVHPAQSHKPAATTASHAPIQVHRQEAKSGDHPDDIQWSKVLDKVPDDTKSSPKKAEQEGDGWNW